MRVRRARRLLVACAACLALTPSAVADEAPWLVLTAPPPDARVRLAVALVELQGRTGTGSAGASPAALGPEIIVGADVVLALDLSQTTLLPSGSDLDGDGVVAELTVRSRPPFGSFGGLGDYGRPFRRWTTDYDDTVVMLEMAAARVLLDRLEAGGSRVGLLTFSGRARERAAIGTPEEARRALEKIRVRADWSGSNLAAAAHTALRMFERAPAAAGAVRPRSLLVVSDGEPTAPNSTSYAAMVARRAAGAVSEAGVPLYALAVGEEAKREDGTFAAMAAITGGRLIELDDPEALRAAIPSLRPGPPDALHIENLTAGRPARAVRVFADGSFDALAPLVPGENRLEVTATWEDGGRVVVQRSVHYERAELETAEDRRRAAALLSSLRRRTRETELMTPPPREETLERRLEIRPERRALDAPPEE